MSDQGIAEAAILLRSIGEEEAAEVFKYLAPKEVQKLGEAMSKIDRVTRDRVAEVLDKFDSEATQHASLGGDSPEYVRAVLTRALGDDKAKFILDRIMQSSDTNGIERLKWMDPALVADLIRSEHPQIIASIMVHLENDHAAAILNELPDRLRHDVVLRVATMDGIQPSALRELNEVLGKVLSGSDNMKKSALGGVRAAAEMLNFLGTTQETAVIEAVREFDAELAQKILDEMFVFDDLVEIDDKGIQLVLREVQSESLVVALKGTSDALKEKVFANMSQRAAEMLRDDLESKGPVKVSEVEAEQKEILKIVRRLSEEGQIALGGSGDEAYV
ncbi:MAG: flagellar motor switch protein FliG [Betaproteobacteria bacterium]|nr:flagellar motor switch protein FliG [Betaproteobacteria bacterium]